MFKFKSITAIVLTTLVSLAGNAAPKNTTLTCKVYNHAGSAVSLYKVENGEAKRLEFRRPGNMDTCRFSIDMEKEGIYLIRKGASKQSAFNYVIYLKPGDNKTVTIYNSFVAVDFDSCKVISPNSETVSLQKWTDLFNNYCKQGLFRNKRDQYVADYSILVKQAEELKRKAVSKNQYFNYLFASKVNAELLYAKAAAFFNYGERMNGDVDTNSLNKTFYQALGKQKFTNACVLQSEHGLQLVKYWLGYKLFLKLGQQEKMLAASFIEKANAISNDSIRRAFILDHMEGVTNYEQFKADIQPFKKLFNTAETKLVYQHKEDELTVYAKGAPAYNFSLTDTKDKTVSLSDFKGKVVVLDIWAMWCAPCLQEKPFFQKIEEEYKDRGDIVFIGVSHDGVARKENWKQFVARKGWEGIELIANYNESIGKYYKVEGIPRLMIFDKEGKIVTVDAPRPSSPEFKKLIDQTLKTSDRVTNP
ncbi:TlpA family protein disulfide reductase [Flavisolibacter tropicus]|uniref:TlpA family protein disulfide reductase n=1 Tax=Flavisolibacter tropicus TaxID=1492898 RepID=UPI0008348DFB|nr:TlpA disulfide reductase family protein [Flavisolibacter tropicus]